MLLLECGGGAPIGQGKNGIFCVASAISYITISSAQIYTADLASLSPENQLCLRALQYELCHHDFMIDFQF